MAVTAKNASKCKNHWYQPFSQTSIDTLVPVADLISPNLRSSGFPGKPGQEFSPKIAYFWRSKMFLQVCTVGLGYKNSASRSILEFPPQWISSTVNFPNCEFPQLWISSTVNFPNLNKYYLKDFWTSDALLTCIWYHSDRKIDHTAARRTLNEAH